jgi:hypothetical protein
MDSETPETPAPAAEEPTREPKRGKRAPLDPEAREALNRRAAMNRLIGKVKAEKDEAKRAQLLEEALAKMGRPRTLESPPPATAPAPPPLAEPLEPGQRPGWPKPSVVARFEPLLLDVLVQVRSMLDGTVPGMLLAPRSGQARDQESGVLREVVVDPCAELARAWAPVAAQYIPEEATTPLATALVVTASLIGLPAMGLVFAWARAKWALPQQQPPQQQPPKEVRA